MAIPRQGIAVGRGLYRHEPFDLDERQTDLDEPARQQAAVAKSIAAVRVAHWARLEADVERPRLAGAHEADRILIRDAMSADHGDLVLGVETLLKLFEKVDAFLEGVLGERRAKVVDAAAG